MQIFTPLTSTGCKVEMASANAAIRSSMSLIMGQIEPEDPELFALEFGKIAKSDFVYTLASTNINRLHSSIYKY